MSTSPTTKRRLLTIWPSDKYNTDLGCFDFERTLTKQQTKQQHCLGMQASGHAPPFPRGVVETKWGRAWSEGGTHTLWCFSKGGEWRTTPYCSDEGPLGPDGLSLDGKTLWEEGCLRDFGRLLWLSQRLVMFKNKNKNKRTVLQKKNKQTNKTARLTKKDHKGSLEWWW